jgi:dATP pyrophosphohydrolase
MSGPAYRRPVSVLVVVFTDDAEVLLLRRCNPFDFWQSVTGSLREDETHAEAAIRELCEETGFTDEGDLSDSKLSRHFDIDPRWHDRFESGVLQNEEFEWRYRLAAARDVRMNAKEHSEYRWLPIEQAIEAVWSWTNREALENLRAELF